MQAVAAEEDVDELLTDLFIREDVADVFLHGPVRAAVRKAINKLDKCVSIQCLAAVHLHPSMVTLLCNCCFLTLFRSALTM